MPLIIQVNAKKCKFAHLLKKKIVVYDVNK